MTEAEAATEFRVKESSESSTASLEAPHERDDSGLTHKSAQTSGFGDISASSSDTEISNVLTAPPGSARGEVTYRHYAKVKELQLQVC